MTALRQFDYIPDQTSFLVKFGKESDRQLSAMCPRLVGALRAAAERQSSSRLFLTSQKSGGTVADLLTLAEVFGGREYLPKAAQQELSDAALFLKISGSTLAQRYLNGTLEPELHVGGATSAAYARAEVLKEAGQPIAEESDADRLTVNGASDGIV